MRISVKGRYALVSMICLGQNYNNGEYSTVISISEKLGISKIYLEQVFSLLKRAGLVNSGKGAQGGYILSKNPREITVFEIMSAVEQFLVEATDETVTEKAPEIERTIQIVVFDSLDSSVKENLAKTTLLDLINEVEKQKSANNMMFFI